ncbi:hypothetical protein KO516_07440 [Citreicella sp. C3M06]|uniref:hypothetical protein n=1 Tax=Citreicella sp. C3M06 TaxID=2841564 RepID=UPI001C0866A5|nr:hypothetical protein [Citreicella sp. C3M06]MBU2960651.1 hypothetical protein [Citreicella sp. C3M06]
MGWKLFLHSVRMVLDNLGVALRLSALLYLVQMAFTVFLFVTPDDSLQQPTAGTVELLLLSIFAVVASLWIAVGWHRFVLTGEEPAGFVPRWHGSEMLSYFGRSLLIGFMLIALGSVIAGLVLGIGSSPALIGLMTFGLVGLGSYIFFRVGLVLPASAMGKRMKMRESWDATSGDSTALLQLALIVIGAKLLIEIPGMIDGNTTGPISLIYGLVIDWFVTMFGVSLLTTLYGVFIEGRRL